MITKKAVTLLLALNIITIGVVLSWAGIWPQNILRITPPTEDVETWLEGMVWLDNVRKAPAVGLANDVRLIVGQDEYLWAMNRSGVDLNEGEAVYITGDLGDRIRVGKAGAGGFNGISLGIVEDPGGILNNQRGYFRIRGLKEDMNTDHLTEGALVYLSTTPGLLTSTPPTPPNRRVVVGVCVKKNITNGSIWVGLDVARNLEELSNVSNGTPSNGDTVRYNSGTGVWEYGP